MSDDREERTRQRAYRIWEEQGRPEGQADAHWDMASELVAIEDSQMSTTIPLERSKAQISAGEPLIALENTGEFPTLTDQGEQQIPRRQSAGGSR